MDALWQSFLDTRVRIFGPLGTTEVVIGGPAERAPGEGEGEHAVHLLTAWNPRGRRATLLDNERRAAALRSALEAGGQGWVPAAGVAEDGTWAEAGVALDTVTLAEALELGRRFEQEAVYRLDGPGGTISVVACFDERTLTRAAGVSDLGPRPCPLAPPGEHRRVRCPTSERAAEEEAPARQELLVALGCDVCGRTA